eukprot:274395-Chlamydomonas_euryale.AAC.1
MSTLFLASTPAPQPHPTGTWPLGAPGLSTPPPFPPHCRHTCTRVHTCSTAPRSRPSASSVRRCAWTERANRRPTLHVSAATAPNCA